MPAKRVCIANVRNQVPLEVYTYLHPGKNYTNDSWVTAKEVHDAEDRWEAMQLAHDIDTQWGNVPGV